MFVNRVSELAALERWWFSGDARMAMVWGRRRVGKTALVRRFAEGRRTVFHTGAGRGQGTELSQLARRVSGLGVTGIRDLMARGYTDWTTPWTTSPWWPSESRCWWCSMSFPS